MLYVKHLNKSFLLGCEILLEGVSTLKNKSIYEVVCFSFFSNWAE